MPSPKALRYESELLALVGQIKTQILAHLDEGSDARQEMQASVNALYERAHKESRRLRKALAFLHTKLEVVETEAKEVGINLEELYKTELDDMGRRR